MSEDSISPIQKFITAYNKVLPKHIVPLKSEDGKYDKYENIIYKQQLCPSCQLSLKEKIPGRLNITLYKNGNLSFRCVKHYKDGGCSTDTILELLELTHDDLILQGNRKWSERETLNLKDPLVISRFVDETGKEIYQIYEWLVDKFGETLKKRIYKFHRDNPDSPRGTGIWKQGDTRIVLYNLQKLVEAPEGSDVYIVQNEIDVASLAVSELLGTMTAYGPEKSYLTRDFSPLHDKNCYLIPTNTAPGKRHMDHIARKLFNHARKIKIITLPGMKVRWNLRDWIINSGAKCKDEINKFIANAVEDSPDYSPQNFDGLGHLIPRLSKKNHSYNAQCFVAANYMHQDHRILHYCFKAFWSWNGKIYIEMSLEELRSEIQTYCDKAENADDGNEFECNKAVKDNIVDALQSVCWIPDRERPFWIIPHHSFPDARFLMPVNNTVLDLSDFENFKIEQTNFHPNLFINYCSPVDYAPDETECKVYEALLNSCWPKDSESQETWDEWGGYGMTADCRFEKGLMVEGIYRGGKGMLRNVAENIIGADNLRFPTINILSGDFPVENFEGALGVIISDATDESDKRRTIPAKAVETLKMIIADDPMSVNIKHKRRGKKERRLHIKPTMFTNKTPTFRDSTGGFDTKWITLGYIKKTHLGEEDTTLSAKLKVESSAILNRWLVARERLYRRNKFIQPAKGKEVKMRNEKSSRSGQRLH